MDLGISGWAVLTLGAAVAGWIDAIIGGGGLILIPLILATVPGLAPATALATNKFAAVTGTASAAFTLTRKVRPPRAELLKMGTLAALCSAAGAFAAAAMDASFMRPLIIVLMVIAGLVVALKPDFGTSESAGIRGGWRQWACLAAVSAIGFYDGIFGPGTGMFLIMAFTVIFSQNFLRSAAMAKVVNTCTNVGALVVFMLGGHVAWVLAIVLAAANVAGAQLGARTVLGGGAKFIRMALLILVVVMSGYLAFQQWG